MKNTQVTQKSDLPIHLLLTVNEAHTPSRLQATWARFTPLERI